MQEQDGDSKRRKNFKKEIKKGCWRNIKEDGGRKEKKSILQFTLVESQKNIILLSSEGRSSVAKQAHSSVTIFPL